MSTSLHSLHSLQQEYRQVTEEKLEVGALIETWLGVEDGLNLPKGRKGKLKKLVIVGIDKENRTCFGSVLVNSRPNPRAEYSTAYMQAQYLLSQANYPHFLRYDSYVDCGVLFAFPMDKLLTGEYYGLLTENDKTGLFDVLETTDTLSTKQKKRFGIRRR